MCIHPGISCRSLLLDITKASQGGGWLLFRPRGRWWRSRHGSHINVCNYKGEGFSSKFLGFLICFSKYRDPLYTLLDYIAEVSTTGLVSYLAVRNTPDLYINHAAGI